MTDNVAGLLCYVIGLITGVLFLVIEPYNKNSFVRFHAFQSIFANLALIALSIVYSIVSAIVFAILPFGLGAMWHMVGMVMWLAVLAIWVMLMIKAYQGARYKLPVIGDMAEKQASR